MYNMEFSLVLKSRSQMRLLEGYQVDHNYDNYYHETEQNKTKRMQNILCSNIQGALVIFADSEKLVMPTII